MLTKIADCTGLTSFVQGFKSLKGNTRTSVTFEVAFGLSSVLYNFYLSLYMKAQGITDEQIGYLISLGFLSSAVCAIFGGFITNRLGRKKTTYIFELIAWPGSILLYLISNNFWMFALARIVNGSFTIAQVSWNLMILEDADDQQRIHAFNLMTIINMALGIITPIGGVIVSAYGVVNSERGFLIFAAAAMITSMTMRNRVYTETSVGKKILEDNKSIPAREELKGLVQMGSLKALFSSASVVLTVVAMLLHTIFFTIGSHMSLYFAVYFTEVLKFDQAAVSVIGGLNSAVLLIVCVCLNPVISKRVTGLKSMAVILIISIALKIIFSAMVIVMPLGSFLYACVAIVIYGIGYGMGSSYTDAIVANVTEHIEKDRAGIYAINYMLSSILSMVIGSVSGYLYSSNPHSIYVMSIIVLAISGLLLAVLMRLSDKKKAAAVS